MKLRVIIIDDEAKGRNVLQELIIRYCPEAEVVATAADAEEGIKAVKHFKPDCIFLDIKMPNMDGFAMLDEVGNNPPGEVVFVTAHNEYALKAFKYAAFDYLLKPVDPEDLKKTFERLKKKIHSPDSVKRIQLLKSIMQQPNTAPSKISISSAEGITIINIADIVYMQADGPYTSFYMANGDKIVASVNLQKYEELLAAHSFFRTHHSYLVNLNCVKKYNKSDNNILLSNGHIAEVSKRKKEEFLLTLSQL